MTISQWNVVVLCIGKKYCHHAMFASPLTTIYFSMHWTGGFCLFEEKIEKMLLSILVNLCQNFLFLHQLTHNMMKDCSLNSKFNAWKFQAQTWGELMYRNCFWHSEQFLHTTCSPHVLQKRRASDKDLPVLSRTVHESLIIKILFSQIYTSLQCFSQGFLNNRYAQNRHRFLNFFLTLSDSNTLPGQLDNLSADQSQRSI